VVIYLSSVDNLIYDVVISFSWEDSLWTVFTVDSSVYAGIEYMTFRTLISDCTCQVKWSFSSQHHCRRIGHYDTVTVSPLVTLLKTIITGSWTREHVARSIARTESTNLTDLYVLLTAYNWHIVGITFYKILYESNCNTYLLKADKGQSTKSFNLNLSHMNVNNITVMIVAVFN